MDIQQKNQFRDHGGICETPHRIRLSDADHILFANFFVTGNKSERMILKNHRTFLVVFIVKAFFL